MRTTLQIEDDAMEAIQAYSKAHGLSQGKAASELIRQWTDALLLCQAVERNGVLVTFDLGLKELSTGDWSRHLLLLKSV